MTSALEALGRSLPGVETLWLVGGLLILLTVAILPSRKRHSDPLRKCMVLSLLAHAMLGCYLGSIHVVTAGRRWLGYDKFDVSLVATSVGPELDGGATGASGSNVRQWDELPASSAVAGPDVLPTGRPEVGTLATPMPKDSDQPFVRTFPPLEYRLATAGVARRELVSPAALLAAEEPAPDVFDLRPAELLSSAARLARPDTLFSLDRPFDELDGRPRRLINGTEDPADNWPLDSLTSDAQPAPAVTDDSGDVPVNDGNVRATQSAGLDNVLARHSPMSGTNIEPEVPRPSVATPVGIRQLGPSAAGAVGPSIYELRRAVNRAEVVASQGGSAETEAAVEAALVWLHNSQSPDGRWNAARFGAGRGLAADGRDRLQAGARADTGVTGLALLAYLGAGHTHAEGDYKQTVRDGLNFLVAAQAADGSLGGDAELYAFMYCHGMATFALGEAYAMTGDATYLPALRKAVNFSLRAQSPATGGWRYRPHDPGDTSQLGWQVMALKSAELGGLPLPATYRAGASRFLVSVAGGAGGGLASYRPGEQCTPAMTAEALVCRQFLGLSEAALADEAADLILQNPPGNGPANVYYWYYGTLALHPFQDHRWEAWNEALSTTLVESQITDGDLAGSWDVDPVWGNHGGRVYSTAMGALCLEVYYRYLPVYGLDAVRTAQSPNASRR